MIWNQLAVVVYLLQAKANPNSLHPLVGWTAMHRAALCIVDGAIIRALAHAGAHLNQQQTNDWTPLHWIGFSSAGGDEDRLMRAEMLVDCGAAPSIHINDVYVCTCVCRS